MTRVSKHQLTRWERFYRESPHFVSVPPSACAEQAARIFMVKGCRTILDLGCGTGRDTFHLAGTGAFLIGLDAAFSGLLSAGERSSNLGGEVLFILADARVLPFADCAFDGVYCFGLLHEFVGPAAVVSVKRIMAEIRRVLRPGGTAVVAVAAGDPQRGLPAVQNFSEAMFDSAISGFHCIAKMVYDDLGCTGRTDYRVWYGQLENKPPILPPGPVSGSEYRASSSEAWRA